MASINNQWEAVKKTEPGFSVASSDRSRGNGHKLKDEKFNLNLIFFM